jgi:hypothetical protein
MPASLGTYLGPAACLVLGVAAFVRPAEFAVQTGIAARSPLGRSELRAVFGGVFVGLAAVCLVLAAPAAYWTTAGAFFGGASAKVLSAALERGVFPAALPGLLVDLVAGGLFVWGARTLG